MPPLINKHNNDSDDSTYDDSDIDTRELVQQVLLPDSESINDSDWESESVSSGGEDLYVNMEGDNSDSQAEDDDEEEDDCDEDEEEEQCDESESDVCENAMQADAGDSNQDDGDNLDSDNLDSDNLDSDNLDIDNLDSDNLDSDSDNLDSDSDAPESISFESGKKNVLKRAAEAMSQIAKEKKEVKIKRQKKDDLYKKQKLEKEEKINSAYSVDNRLPEALLNDIAGSSNMVQDSDSELDDESDIADYESSENEDLENEDIENGNAIRAVTMNDVNHITQNRMDELSRIRDNRYGGKYNIRISNKNKKAQIEKRRAR